MFSKSIKIRNIMKIKRPVFNKLVNSFDDAVGDDATSLRAIIF